MDASDQFSISLLLCRLCIRIPVHIGEAPEKGLIPQSSKFEIFIAESADKASGKSSTFTVKSNQNVSWDIDAAVKPSYRYTYKDYKNKTATSVTGGYTIDSIVESTGAISKITTDVKVTATTKAEQKISLIIKQYIA